MTLQHKDLKNPATLTGKELQHMQFMFNEAFQVQFANHHPFLAEKVVRIIPSKRLVAFGTWMGKPAVAKLFFDAKNAKRQMEKDVAGIKTLQDNKVPTPSLYYQGVSEDKHIHALIYERIMHADDLEENWNEADNKADILPLLYAVIIEIATQHVLGIQQNDLHLKNFLVTEKTIYTIDGGEIECTSHRLPKLQSMNNLALFLSQLGVGVEALQEKCFRHYAKARGWLLKPTDIIDMFLMIKKWNEVRYQKFEKKIFRSSTNFVCVKDLRTFCMYDRSHSRPEFLQFLSHPDSAFSHPSAMMLKDGRSSTVVKITLDQIDLVVKRYNMKNLWHRLRRCFRETRALTSWRFAQKLTLFGLKTAKPVAFIEKKWLGLRGKSYYVSEYVSGEHAGDYFVRHRQDEAKAAKMVKRICELLKNLGKVEMTHGDLKITNILINNKEQPILIDLDGTEEHASLGSLRQASKKEMKRFLANFHDQPSVLKRFKLEWEGQS